MHLYDQDGSEISRRKAEVRRNEGDVDAQAAHRAAAAGRVDSVGPGAVLRLQRLAGNAGVSSLVEEDAGRSPVLDVVGKGGGAPLPDDVRSRMESGLGADFGDVRVHHDAAAASSAQAVQAKAYTVGNEIVFNRGAYDPDSAAGQHTLAHELSHVVQQRSGPVDGAPTGDGISLSHPDDRFERQAESNADSFDRGEAVPPSAAPAGASIQREESDNAEPVGGPASSLQREDAVPEEEDIAAQPTPLQREEAAPEEEEEPTAT